MNIKIFKLIQDLSGWTQAKYMYELGNHDWEITNIKLEKTW